MINLSVYTSCTYYVGADRLDVSVGQFAPSQPLRNALRVLRRKCLTDRQWAQYVDAYTVEMRVNYREQWQEWERVLALPLVTLCCYCPSPDQCHRTVLAQIFARFGATPKGERKS